MFEPGWGLAIIALPIILALNLLLTFLGVKALYNKQFLLLWRILLGFFSIIIILLMIVGSRHLIVLGILTYFVPQVFFMLIRTNIKQHFLIHIIVIITVFFGMIIYYAVGLASGISID